MDAPAILTPGRRAASTGRKPARSGREGASVLVHRQGKVRQIRHVAVGTDRSRTATPAVELAAELANRYGAELYVIQVLLPGHPPETEAGQAEAMRASRAAGELRQVAGRLAGPRGHARVIVDADPAMAIVRAAEEADADLLVVGNVGMAGRREFLLGNVPNRVSHNARCSVLIVNTADTACVLEPYPRLDVPAVYKEYSTPRLLVMQEIQGVPIRKSAASPERAEAARQLLESYYRQILTDGFFHADPHPGNLMWWQGKIYFIDFGMVGEVGPELRELLILMLMAFWQEDVAFLSDVVLMIAGSDQRPDIDVAAFQADLGALLARYRHLSLKDVQLGPILQEMTEIAIRHDVPLPTSLTLTGKALAQMQLATAELDPTLDPFAVAGQFLMRKFRDEAKDRMDPQKLFYEGQKLRMRTVRLVESIERVTGARPGPKLQVDFRGTERLEDNIWRAGRRLSLALVAGALWVATAFAAASAHIAGWIPLSLASLGGVFTLGLGIDLVRRHGQPQLNPRRK